MHTHTFSAYLSITIVMFVSNAKAGILGDNGKPQIDLTLQNKSGFFNKSWRNYWLS
jgi:hypothetical protein